MYPVLDVNPETTAQEVFDAVIAHLVRQGGPAYSGKFCHNRMTNGRACAVACLMTDEEAAFTSGTGEILMPGDGDPWNSRTHKNKPERLHRFENLLSRLQIAHDSSKTLDQARDKFEYVAATFGLSFDPAALVAWNY